jgi:cytochrome c5
MMKLKIMMICVLVLLASACESNGPGEQQVAPATSAVDQEKIAPVVQPESQIIEPPVVEEVKSQEAQQPVVAAVSQPLSGEAIYKKTCIGCHASGAANAPKLGDKVAWKPRIAKGMDVLLQSAINGVPGTAMMKRGTCASCSDEDLKAVVEYMVKQSK